MARSIASIPQPGDIINGQFQLGRELGRGSFGVVFEARQMDLQRPVAIKVLQPRALARDDVAERFKREALLASSLTSRHSVTVYAFGVIGETPQVQGLPFIAMEYLEGEDLYYLLARRGQLGLHEALPVLYQGLMSLAEAHARGIIHRDLKPENLFVCRNGDETIVKVLDFGIAKAIGGEWDASARQRLTEVGMVCGTPEFMAPEQASGEPLLTPAVDVYAMGCIGYQLLSGRQPYEGNSPMDIALKHMTHPVPALPPEYEGSPIAAILRKAMAKAPEERYANATEFARALEALARQLGVGLQLDLVSIAPVSGEFLPYEDDAVATQISRRGTDGQRARDTEATHVVRGRTRGGAIATDSLRAVPASERPVMTHASPGGGAAAFRDTAVTAPPLDRLQTAVVSRPPGPEAIQTNVMPVGYATIDDLSTAIVRTDRPRREGDNAPTVVGPAPEPPAERRSSPVALYAGGVAVLLLLCVAAVVTVVALLPDEPGATASSGTAGEVVVPAPALPPAVVVLESIPSQAEVFEGDVHLGQTPLTVRRPRASEPMKVTLRKSGFQDTTAQLPLNVDGVAERTITLVPDNVRVPAPVESSGDAGEEAAGEPADAGDAPIVAPEIQTPPPRVPPGHRPNPIRRRTPPRETGGAGPREPSPPHEEPKGTGGSGGGNGNGGVELWR